MKNQLRAGVLLSYVNLGISFLIPIFYTPLMLRMLGQAEYGLYSLASSTVAYLNLLSFGFGTTIIRYIAKYRAERDQRKVEETYGFFLLLYSAIGVMALAGGILLAANTEGIFSQGLSSGEIRKIKRLMLIMAVNTAMSFPLSVFSSMAIAHERYLFRRIMDIVSTVAAPVANLIALFLGFASAGMALAGTVIKLLLAPISIGYCFRVLKLKPRFVRLPSALMKEMVGFSLFIFIDSLVNMLFWSTDKVILGMLASTIAVAVYNVGGTFNSIVMQLSTSISGVLIPRVTGMVTTHPRSEWSALVIKIGRIQFLIVALILSGFTVFGRQFLELWAGPEYADAYWVALLTLYPLCVPLIQNTALNFVIAQNKHQFRSIVYLIIAILNVISTWLVVPTMGIIGAALCSCVSYLLGQGLIMNIYYYKVTGLDIPGFWKNILKISIVPGLMLVAGLALNRVVVINNWITFFAGVVLYTAVYAALMYRFTMNDYEKNMIRSPLRKILRISGRT